MSTERRGMGLNTPRLAVLPSTTLVARETHTFFYIRGIRQQVRHVTEILATPVSKGICLSTMLMHLGPCAS